MPLPGFGMDDDVLEQRKAFAQRVLYPLGLEVHLAHIGRGEEVAVQNGVEALTFGAVEPDLVATCTLAGPLGRPANPLSNRPVLRGDLRSLGRLGFGNLYVRVYAPDLRVLLADLVSQASGEVVGLDEG